MKCEKCGMTLNAWNPVCPSCGTAAPAAPVQDSASHSSSTVTYSNGASSFAKLSLVCWIGMLIFSLVSFRFIGGFYFRFLEGNIISSGLNIICVLALLFGTVVSTRNGRMELMAVPMGLFSVALLIGVFLLNRLFGFAGNSNLLYLIYIAMTFVVTLLFFIGHRNQSGARGALVASIVCAVIWVIVLVVGHPRYYSAFYGYGGANGIGVLLSSSAIKDLLFFGGTALLSCQSNGGK